MKSLAVQSENKLVKMETLTEEQVRKIIREEIKKAKDEGIIYTPPRVEINPYDLNAIGKMLKKHKK